jgi:hypothetical protein
MYYITVLWDMKITLYRQRLQSAHAQYGGPGSPRPAAPSTRAVYAGLMFWFTRQRFPGSDSALIRASRA